jgi:uncharacterized membrane protein
MGLSNLGIFHTLIGVIAIVAAVVSYIKFCKINLAAPAGKIYFYTTIITSLTALGISKHGGFNAGHVLSLFVVIIVLVAYYLYAKRKGNNRSRYWENFCLTFSFFISWLPTVNETFTRVPAGHPLAKDISDPLIGKTILVLFLLFVSGSVLQYIKQRRINVIANR